MANPLLGQILGSVFSSAMGARNGGGPFGRADAGTDTGASPATGIGGGVLGGLLGGLLGRNRANGTNGTNGTANGGPGGRGMLLAMLLPFAMQWVQRNGGIGAVLERFKSKGLGPQAQSWVSTGANEPLDAQAVDHVVGREEIARMAQKLGVTEQEVSQGFAEIMPEMVDQLSPGGQVPPEANDALEAGQSQLERMLRELQGGSNQPH